MVNLNMELKTIELPAIFTEEVWKDMGEVADWKKHIGKPRVSYSQINTWTNMSYEKEPKQAYIREKFLGIPKMIPEAFGQFGDAVEDYICFKKNEWGFSQTELDTLNKIKPLGTFQTPILIDFETFVLIGYLDDSNKTTIRDYKTASNSSKEQYLNGEYKKLHIYALDWLLNKGKMPKKLEVVIIERNGNAFGGGALTVGGQIWVKDFKPTEEELLTMKKLIIDTVSEISDYYKVFKKFTVKSV
ncbi:MAG: hypothetical protein WD512_19655 [Candidatus Paceibacterota bacterium]